MDEDASRNRPAIRVLIADDHAMFREGIVEMLRTGEGIDVVGEAENGERAVAMTRELAPDVVLLDVDMPQMGAEEAIGRMLQDSSGASSPPRIVIVTMHDEPRLVRELIGLGASAYLVKSASLEELLSAVRSVASTPMGPDRDAVMVVPPEVYRDPEEADGLTERELEVLLLAARGMSNDQIATSLYISEATAKRHLANIYPKVGASSRAEAVRVALTERWISARDMTGGGNGEA